MCWTCENPDGDFEGELLKKIDRWGWALVGVEAGEESSPYAYTVGLPYSFDHPELVMVGQLDEVFSVLRGMVEYISRSGRELEPDQTMLLGEDRYTFVAVDQQRLDDGEIASSDEVHERLGAEQLPAVEVVEFPWPLLCEQHFDEQLYSWMAS